MSMVTLVSGGLDSTLVAFLAREQGLEQHPLFIDYGQRARDRELAACRAAMSAVRQAQTRVEELNQRRQKNKQSWIHYGIGLHVGMGPSQNVARRGLQTR